MLLTPGKHTTQLVEAHVHRHTRDSATATDIQCFVSNCKHDLQEERSVPDIGWMDEMEVR